MAAYICPECGNNMIFEDDYHNFLVCEKCGYSCNTDEYGKSDKDDEYEDIYPFEESNNEEDCDEPYDEVYDELSHALDD